MESDTVSLHSAFYRGSKAGRGAGKLYGGKKGRFQVCPDWQLSAWGRCRLEVVQPMLVRGWLEVHSWLSLICPMLEMDTKKRETFSYESRPGFGGHHCCRGYCPASWSVARDRDLTSYSFDI